MFSLTKLEIQSTDARCCKVSACSLSLCIASPGLLNCDARDIRLFQGKKTLDSNNDSGDYIIDWLTIDDSEVKQMERIDCFQEIVGRFMRPEVEMHDEKLLYDYFHEGTLLPIGFNQVHVLVYIPPPFLRVYCSETKQMETPEFVIELRRAEAAKK